MENELSHLLTESQNTATHNNFESLEEAESLQNTEFSVTLISFRHCELAPQPPPKGAVSHISYGINQPFQSCHDNCGSMPCF